MKSLHVLLSEAIDYAGLFPPAKLDMESALRNYAAYREDQYAWALGRFIVPAAWLSEFERTFALLPEPHSEQWHVSALLGSSLQDELAAITRFNKGPAPGRKAPVTIDTVEVKASAAAEIRQLGNAIPRSLRVFVEIPIGQECGPLVDAIKEAGLRAKVRTGGLTADAFPASAALAEFIKTCATEQVAFKATAGLHHPLRADYSLTYEPNSPHGTMFGFMNVLLAASVAFDGGSISEIVDALEERQGNAFAFDDTALTWHDHHVNRTTLASIRNGLFASFGSCSFAEPIEELQSLGLL